MSRIAVLQSTLLAALLFAAQGAFAHGGVVEEDDLCVINIGYLKAHFKIYLPQQRGHREYCEDIPLRGESVFVMEYQHDSLNSATIDFRIIDNVTGMGRFARLEHIQAIDDLDAVTLRYAPPASVPDVFMLLQDFERSGEYVGIVSATAADSGKVYTAVFPFEVGYTGLGIWPWVVLALVLLQLNFWFMRRRRAAAAVLALVAVFIAPGAAADDGHVSADGNFRITFESDVTPIVINRMHGWTLHVARADGSAVSGANVTIEGGMPEHDHGLPTAPRVVAGAQAGVYRIEGLRFHMGGYWEIHISIDDGRHRDKVMLPLEL